MATGMYFAQEAKWTCHVHTGVDITIFCDTCHVRLCYKCVEEKHLSHGLSSVRKAATEARLHGLTTCKEVTDEHIPKLERFTRNLVIAKKKNSQKQFEIIEKVNKCKNMIVEITQARADEIIDFLESENRDVNEKIDKGLLDHTVAIDTLKSLVETFTQNMVSGSDHGIIELKESIETVINKFKIPDFGYLSRSPNFIEGMVNTKAIELMFGHFKKMDVSTEKPQVVPILNVSLNKPGMVTVSREGSFVFKVGVIRGISAISETEAWIHRSKQTTNELLTIQGKQIQQLDTGKIISHFTVANNGDTIYTDFDGCRIMRIRRSGKKTTLLDTAPLHPWGISHSLYGGLLVTLMDGQNYNTDTKSQRFVQKITLTGEITKTYQFGKDKNEQLFTVPYRICQNYNTDICVVDRTTENSGQVYILLEDGTVRYRYTGTGSSRFDPTDVACDINCNILICDYQNQIHFLHHSGHFLKFLITQREKLGCPSSMCLYNDKLWIGCNDGNIRVFKYEF